MISARGQFHCNRCQAHEDPVNGDIGGDRAGLQFQDASGGQQFDQFQNLIDFGHYRQVKGRIQIARSLHTDLPFAAHPLKGSARGSRGFSVYPNGSLWG